MSLVVARRWGSMIVLASDTHATDHHGTGYRFLEGIVKIRILAEDICVAFAGMLSWAETALSEIDALQNLNHDAVVSVLERVHNQSGRLVDFIVAVSRPAPCLTEIKEGSSREVVAAWIGSQPAFAKFQSLATESHPPEPGPTNTYKIEIFRLPEGQDAQNDGYYSIVKRMCAVINDPDYQEVGGFVVPVALHKGRFEFMDYATVLTHPIRFDLMPAEFVVPFGTAEEGGYAFNFMGGNPSTTGLAIYALQGRCGAAFVLNAGRQQTIPYSNMAPPDFEEQVEARGRFHVGCMFTTPHHFTSRALRYLEDGNALDALIEAEKAVARSNQREPTPFRCRGIVNATLGRLDIALADFSTALDLDPTHAATWDNRGLIYARLGRLTEAVADFTRAIESDPNYVRGYQHRAMASRELNNEAQALADDAKSRGQNP